MKILGVDSSGMVASVAILENEIVVAEYSVNHKKTHSQTLLPMIDEIVKMTDTKLEEIDAIAVAAGPGSFTGLRIGAATVKGLAMSINKPIISVPTCHGMAYNLVGVEGIVCPIMDARRNQVYTGIYEFVNGKMNVLYDQDAMDINDLIDKLNSMNRKVTFLGDGVPVYSETIKETIKCQYAFAGANMNRQRAASVATLGMEYYNAGIFESADEHKPIYLRKSQAEREREEKAGQQ